MIEIESGLTFNLPQYRFLESTAQFRAYVAGYRGGKTFAGISRAFILALKYPGIKQAYFAPTYDLIRDIYYPTAASVAEKFGITIDVAVNAKEVKVYFRGKLKSTIKCRSMDRPEKIIGFDCSHAHIDEIDTLPREKAEAAWNKIIARLSTMRADYPVNTADFTTTPEGFNYVHWFFVEQIQERPELANMYQLFQASTLDNAVNLQPGYIESLYATYNERLVKAYIHGNFCNMVGGSVYYQYDEEKNDTDMVWQPGMNIHVGIDFNVYHTNAKIHVIDRDGDPHCVDEIVDADDTPTMIKELKSRYKNTRIYVYPDASGSHEDTRSAGLTDFTLLRNAGFILISPPKNPYVKDRINIMNSVLCDGLGKRRYKINKKMCPVYSRSLVKQAWKNGKPDKDGQEHNHNDAGGYFISRKYNVVRSNYGHKIVDVDNIGPVNPYAARR